MKTLLTILLISTSISTYADILSQSERKQISRYLDDICPDTYCGGDINWTNPKIVCNAKYCSVIIEAASYYANEPFFSVKEFMDAPQASKKGQGFKLLSAESFKDEHSEYNRETREYDYSMVDNTRVTSWCRLELSSHINSMTYHEKEDDVYEAALDCVDKIEAAIYEL